MNVLMISCSYFTKSTLETSRRNLNCMNYQHYKHNYWLYFSIIVTSLYVYFFLYNIYIMFQKRNKFFFKNLRQLIIYCKFSLNCSNQFNKQCQISSRQHILAEFKPNWILIYMPCTNSNIYNIAQPKNSKPQSCILTGSIGTRSYLSISKCTLRTRSQSSCELSMQIYLYHNPI